MGLSDFNKIYVILWFLIVIIARLAKITRNGLALWRVKLAGKFGGTRYVVTRDAPLS